MSNFYRDIKQDEQEAREEKAIQRAVDQIIQFKEEKGYLLNGNISMICQKNLAKVRPVRARLKEMRITN